MNYKSYTPLFLVLISTLLFISGCQDKTEKRTNPNTLNMALRGEVPTLDPANAYDTISASVIYQCYETMYEYHYLKRPYTLKPLLADGMPLVENGGKRYTIKIKKGIRYHNDPSFYGKIRYLKAQDFINQIKRLAFVPTKSNGWWLFDGKIVGINKFRKDAGNDLNAFKRLSISGLQATDDHTLVINLTRPYPQMLYALAMSFTAPVPLEVITQYNNILNDKIIGTGPFKLGEWVRSSKITLDKFEHYHDSQFPSIGDRHSNDQKLLQDAGKRIPFLGKIIFHIMKEDQTRWLNFQSKKIDMSFIDKDNFQTAINADGKLSQELKNKNIKLQISPSLTYWWLSFNMKDPIVGKNLKLRQAIAHAVNMDRYLALFTNNIGLKANSIYPPGIFGYDPGHQLPFEYNLETARKLLAEAGYPGGKGLPVLKYDVRGSSPTNRQQAEYIKAELNKINIRTKISLNSFPRFLDKVRSGQLQFWQGGWAMDYPDAENSLQLLTTQNHAPGPNSSFYSNPKFDKYFEELKIIPNGKKKLELMRKMEEIIQEDLPWIMQYYSKNYFLHHGYLKNYRHSDVIYNYMKYLRKE
jgi:oligopeptide transport system substrate-binding protein